MIPRPSNTEWERECSPCCSTPREAQRPHFKICACSTNVEFVPDCCLNLIHLVCNLSCTTWDQLILFILQKCPRKLSYSQSLKDSKELLEQYGVKEVSEKSFKASGVTVLLDKKTSITDVQIYGGWKSEQTPLFYHNSSISRRMDISAVLW